MDSPASANVLPVHSSTSKGPLDLFTAATRLKSAFHFPLTSPLRRTFICGAFCQSEQLSAGAAVDTRGLADAGVQ